MQHYWRGTGAGKPLTAHTHAAGSRQRERGELPQQPSGARRGIAASPQAGGARTEHQSCAGHSLAKITLSSRPTPVCFPRPWELLLCCSCAAQSTHRRCSYVSQSRKTWDCNACAGEGTGKRPTAACWWALALLQSLWPKRDGSQFLPMAGIPSCSPSCLPLQPPAPCHILLASAPSASRDQGHPNALRHQRAAAPTPSARHHLGQLTVPPCLRAASRPARAGQAGGEAALVYSGIKKALKSPEDTVGAAVMLPQLPRAAPSTLPDRGLRGPRGTPLQLAPAAGAGKDGAPRQEATLRCSAGPQVPHAGARDAVGPAVTLPRLPRAALQTLPDRGLRAPRGAPLQLAPAAGADKDSGPRQEAALHCSAGPQVPHAGAKDAVGAGRHQPVVLRDARTDADNGEHRGPRGFPQRLMEAGPGSQGGPGLEAARLFNVGLQKPTASPKDAAGAGPGGDDQPRGEGTPEHHAGSRLLTAGSNDAIGAAVYQLHMPSKVIKVHSITIKQSSIMPLSVSFFSAFPEVGSFRGWNHGDPFPPAPNPFLPPRSPVHAELGSGPDSSGAQHFQRATWQEARLAAAAPFWGCF